MAILHCSGVQKIPLQTPSWAPGQAAAAALWKTPLRATERVAALALAAAALQKEELRSAVPGNLGSTPGTAVAVAKLLDPVELRNLNFHPSPPDWGQSPRKPIDPSLTAEELPDWS
jgi:hypothetical protein